MPDLEGRRTGKVPDRKTVGRNECPIDVDRRDFAVPRGREVIPGIRYKPQRRRIQTLRSRRTHVQAKVVASHLRKRPAVTAEPG